MDSQTPLRQTPLFEEHQQLRARIVPYTGWAMPVQYKGLVDEHRAVRQKAGIFDVSHMGVLVLSGEHAESVIDYLVTNDVKKIEDGQALYACACNEEGGILDDLIVYRVAADRFLVVCNAGNRDKIAEHLRNAAENHCEFEDLSDRTAILALQGPLAMEILSLAGKDAEKCTELSHFHFRDAIVANVETTVARTGYTGEDGVEIFCRSEDAPQLWRTLLDLGRSLGLEPAGLGARDTLRLEVKLSLYGNDIDETTNPYEAGLGWTVKLDKGDFLGREALRRIKEEGPARKLIGFEMVGRGIARNGYPLLDKDGQTIGICTSGSPGPTVGKNIGLGYLPAEMSKVGTEFLVDCRGRQVPAVVVKTPFYKRPAR